MITKKSAYLLIKTLLTLILFYSPSFAYSLFSTDCGYVNKDLEEKNLTFNNLGICNEHGSPWTHMIFDQHATTNSFCIYKNSLYFAEDRVVYKNINGTENYRKITEVFSNNIVFLYPSNDTLYAVTENLDIFKTNDTNSNWEKITDKGLTEKDARFYSLYSYSDDLYLGTSKGSYKLDKNNPQWEKFSNLNVSDFCFHNNCLFGASPNGSILKSCDEGKTWKALDDGTKGIDPYWNHDTPNKLYSHFGLLFQATNYGYVLVSSNNGENWRKVSENPALERTIALHADSKFLYAIDKRRINS